MALRCTNRAVVQVSRAVALDNPVVLPANPVAVRASLLPALVNLGLAVHPTRVSLAQAAAALGNPNTTGDMVEVGQAEAQARAPRVRVQVPARLSSRPNDTGAWLWLSSPFTPSHKSATEQF